MFRLSPISYVVVGVVLMLMIFTGFYFLKIGPEVKEINMYAEKSDELDEIISEPSKKAAVQRVREAKTKVRDAEVQWKQVAAWRTPSTGTLNLTPNRWQLVVNTRRWHSKAEADLNRWAERGGVTMVSPARILVPYPTDQPNELVQYYFNYPALPFPVAIWDLGTITVLGTWDEIMRNVRSWSLIPGYIASVRGLSISGTGSQLTATYGLTVVVYVNTAYVSGGPAEGGGVPQIGGGDAPGGGMGAGNESGGTMARPGAGGQAGPAPVGGNAGQPTPMLAGGR